MRSSDWSSIVCSSDLLVTGKARSPGEILAVTFTNKAARDMKDRVAALLNRPSVEGWWLGTFHAVAVRILRRHAEAVGLKSNFTILDPDDQVRLVKQLLQAENRSEEHTSELQSLMRISYAVFCLKKKK